MAFAFDILQERVNLVSVIVRVSKCVCCKLDILLQQRVVCGYCGRGFVNKNPAEGEGTGGAVGFSCQDKVLVLLLHKHSQVSVLPRFLFASSAVTNLGRRSLNVGRASQVFLRTSRNFRIAQIHNCTMKMRLALSQTSNPAQHHADKPISSVLVVSRLHSGKRGCWF